MPEGNRIYAVAILNDAVDVKVDGQEQGAPIQLNWYEGQIGAMPLFRDKESAEAAAKMVTPEAAVFALEIG